MCTHVIYIFGEIQILSSVFQGTVLGPLQFIIALLDMPSVTRIATVTNYAVDTKSSQAIKKNNQDGVTSLQLNQNSVYKRAEINSMQFNAGRVQALYNQLMNTVQSTYIGLEGTTIPELRAVKYLGTTLVG